MRCFWSGAALALLVVLSGCVSDDEPPPRNGRKSVPEETRQGKARRKSRRDPVDDMFFGIGKRAETPSFAKEGLNERERSIVDSELRGQDDDIKAMRQYHRNFDSERSKRREWVYGFKTPDRK